MRFDGATKCTLGTLSVALTHSDTGMLRRSLPRATRRQISRVLIVEISTPRASSMAAAAATLAATLAATVKSLLQNVHGGKGFGHFDRLTRIFARLGVGQDLDHGSAPIRDHECLSRAFHFTQIRQRPRFEFRLGDRRHDHSHLTTVI